MGDAGLVGLRRDDPHIVGQRAGDPLGDVEARRMDAVIVGDEDFHAGDGEESPLRSPSAIVIPDARSAVRDP